MISSNVGGLKTNKREPKKKKLENIAYFRPCYPQPNTHSYIFSKTDRVFLRFVHLFYGLITLTLFFSCRYDYLRITNGNNQTIGTYCGQRSGQNVLVNGNYAVISFHSDGSVRRRGYELIFSHVPGKNNDNII